MAAFQSMILIFILKAVNYRDVIYGLQNKYQDHTLKGDNL